MIASFADELLTDPSSATGGVRFFVFVGTTRRRSRTSRNRTKHQGGKNAEPRACRSTQQGGAPIVRKEKRAPDLMSVPFNPGTQEGLDWGRVLLLFPSTHPYPNALWYAAESLLSESLPGFLGGRSSPLPCELSRIAVRTYDVFAPPMQALCFFLPEPVVVLLA